MSCMTRAERPQRKLTMAGIGAAGYARVFQSPVIPGRTTSFVEIICMSSDASLQEHLLRPHLRPIQPVPVQKDGQQFVALRDPAMLRAQTMVVPPQVMQALQLFQGKLTVDEIAQRLGGPKEQVEKLIHALDETGLLWGPTFEQLERQRWAELEADGAFPVRASAMLGQDEESCRSAMDQWFAQTDDPEIDGTVTAVIAPHLDYARGWPNYAAAWYPLQNAPAPDRVVILGTNHFGIGDGVVGTRIGFRSPLGLCPADEKVTRLLDERLGKPLFVDQIDHLAEHSIELQLPWIQYCFGNVPIVPALIPDPLVGMLEDADGERVTTKQFTDALHDILQEVGGRTLFVASCDLSHVGPQFGEPRPVDDQRRMDVERHDREMMGKFLDADAEEFLASMNWNQNPTRWCSVGSMTALLGLLRSQASQRSEPDSVELIDYRQAVDPRGMAMVTSAAMVAVSSS